MRASPSFARVRRADISYGRVEWAAVPKELGRRTFNYSAIDSKMVKKLTARFKYFGEKIYG